MLTLPNIQKMNMGEEDSTRFIKRTKPDSKLNAKFDELLKEDEQSVSPNRKRVKQGDISKSWMTAQIIQNVESGLRRKDAEQFPGKDNFKTFLTEKVNLKGRKDFSLLENSANLAENSSEVLKELGSGNKKDQTLKESGLLKNSKDKKYSEITGERFFKNTNEAVQIHFSDIKSDKQDFLENDLSKAKVEKQLSNFPEKNESNSLNQFDNIEDISTIRVNDSNSLKDLVRDIKSENLSDNLTVGGSKVKSDLQNLDFKFNFISDNFPIDFNSFSSNQSKLAEPIIRHLTQNISNIYNFSLDRIINSFDNISFKPIESGFALKMRLYPEELGELELHLKKEGLNISLVAFVMNEEAKQVMMNDTQNLANFFMNQGYNLEQIMVEVKNENQNQNSENFDKIIAENKNLFSLKDEDENPVEKRGIYSIKKFGYFKGIGRLINKYV